MNEPKEEPAKISAETNSDAEKSTDNSNDLIKQANLAADRLEAGNKELAKLLEMQQKLIIEKTVSGQATAGVTSESKEEKQQRQAKEMLKGTGMEDYAFPDAKTDSSYN